MNPYTPPLETLQRALREVTETLAAELATPTTAAPRWPEWQWQVARAVASIHGVSPLLAHSLRWPDAPEGWTAFLADQRQHTASRVHQIDQVLSSLGSRAREIGIAIVALKGAELHALELYAAGERPMADLDLLVRPHEVEPTMRLLASRGLRQSSINARHRVFEPEEHGAPSKLGEHSANPLKIELHTAISEHLPVDCVDITHLIMPRDPRPGINGYPSRAALLTHLLLHCAGGMIFRGMRLIQLQDIRLLAARMTEDDWNELLGSPDSERWWLFPPLKLADRYFSCIPAAVLERCERQCPRSLARRSRLWTLTDLSISYLWIDAFPGIAWATTLGARARYALGRIFPEREMRVARAELVRTDAKYGESDWAKLSQPRRILRWLTSRPPRVETMAPVQAALGARFSAGSRNTR
jgi:hypothetical protein